MGEGREKTGEKRMSLQERMWREIPEETARIARTIYPKGNLFMQIRDELGELFSDADFADLYPRKGQGGISPSLLASVLVMQSLADYSDRQAAEAVRDQISWKYALGLELDAPGFDYSVLSEFRQRLVEAGAHERLFQPVLEKLAAKGLLKGRGKQRTDASHVVARVRNLNRLELVGEALRTTLNRLAEVAPQWLQERLPREWVDRYASRFNTWHVPKSGRERQALTVQIGADGYRLLSGFSQIDDPLSVPACREVEVLRRIWIQQFWRNEVGEVLLRDPKDMPKGADLIVSPFDVEARFSQDNGDKAWVGYKTHWTETCQTDAPRLIVDVQTGLATESDAQRYPSIQAALQTKDLLPEEHYLDSSYSSLANLLQSREVGVDMYSPMRPLSHWQSQQADGLDLHQFAIDWEKQLVYCPHGKVSTSWSQCRNERQQAVIHVGFAPSDCRPCPLKTRCTRSQSRTLKFYPRPEYETLIAQRQRQQTPAFQKKYRIRAGIEGTFSMAVRRYGLRRTPFLGLSKTNLHTLLIACALNLIRALNWLHDVPLATTRKSPLATLVA